MTRYTIIEYRDNLRVAFITIICIYRFVAEDERNSMSHTVVVSQDRGPRRSNVKNGRRQEAQLYMLQEVSRGTGRATRQAA